MPDFLKTILLGVVEGITEFLPISSTGHLIVAAAVLDFHTAFGETFEIAIQFGAVVAVILFYRRELLNHLRGLRSDAQIQQFWMQIIIASVPAALIGFLLRHFIKEVLFSPLVVAISLIVGGIVLIWVEKVVEKRGVTVSPAIDKQPPEAAPISTRQAVIVGVAQMFSLIPGVSRSGASIVGGLIAGLERAQATRFSFFLALPVLGGATLFDLLSSLRHIQMSDLGYLLLGMVVSAVVAWLAIGWLLRYVAHHSLAPFGYYRIAAGALILLFIAVSWIPLR